MSNRTSKSNPKLVNKLVIGIFQDENPNGIFYDFIGYTPDDPAYLELRNRATGEIERKRRLDLFVSNGRKNYLALSGKSEEEIKAQYSKVSVHRDIPNLESLPANLVGVAKNIVYVVEYVERELKKRKKAFDEDKSNRKAKFAQTEVLKEILQDLRSTRNPPNDFKLKVPQLTQYYEYLRKYQEHRGSIANIAVSCGRSTKNITKIAKEIVHLLSTIISLYFRKDNPAYKRSIYAELYSLLKYTDFYWFKQPTNQEDLKSEDLKELIDRIISLDEIIQKSNGKLEKAPVKVPSPSWVNGFLRWFERDPEEGSKVLEGVYGKDFWERNFLVFDHFRHKAQKCLQYVFADHYRLDLYVTDDETRRKKKVLWLTLLIDAYSLAIVGYFISEKNPCIGSIQGALLNAIWPKKISEELRSKYGDWVTQGIPIKLFLDNAWAHLSRSLVVLCSIISQGGFFSSIDLNWRPPYMARYGAIIEALFGNFAGKLRDYLRSAIQKNTTKGSAYNEKNICLLAEDVNYIVLRIILDYMHSPHSSLGGKTPHQKWLEGIETELDFSISVPTLTDEVERQFWWLWHESRPLTSQGFCMFGLHYRPDPSQKSKPFKRVNKSGKKQLYDLRYDPQNINRLAVFKKDSGEWLGDVWAKELQLANDDYENRSLAEQRAINSLSYERKKEYTAEADTRREIKAREDQRLKEKKQIEHQQRLEEARQKKKESTKATSDGKLNISLMQAAFEGDLKGKNEDDFSN